jgi:hypothetical protein
MGPWLIEEPLMQQTLPPESSLRQGKLPFDYGIMGGLRIYARRLLGVLAAAGVGFLFALFYAMIYKLGMKALFALIGIVLGFGASFLLASLEHTFAHLGRILAELLQQLRYFIEQCIAILLLIALAPVFFVIALLVRLESRGPVFVRRTKVGRYGHPFSRLTFRTAEVPSPDYVHGEVNSESVPTPKVTRIGRILRETSLDELPMLINVAKGDMSLFGEPAATPYALLNSAPLSLQKLMFRPGVLPAQRGIKWDVDIPSEVLEFWQKTNQATLAGKKHDVQRLVLFGFLAGEGENSEVVVLPFIATSDSEFRTLGDRISRLTSSRVDILAGGLTHSAALIEAAWTAWYDLRVRPEDRHLNEEFRPKAFGVNDPLDRESAG